MSSAPALPRSTPEKHALEQWIAETPATATVKGMYPAALLRSLDGLPVQNLGSSRYVPFKDYPLRDYMGLLMEGARLLHPDKSPREGLRHLGKDVYPTLAKSTVGRVIFSIAGKNWLPALKLAPRAYGISLSPAKVTLCDVRDNSARLELRDVWNFGDTYQVGVFEGAMQTFGVEGSVRARRLKRRCDVDLLMEW